MKTAAKKKTAKSKTPESKSRKVTSNTKARTKKRSLGSTDANKLVPLIKIQTAIEIFKTVLKDIRKNPKNKKSVTLLKELIGELEKNRQTYLDKLKP